MKLLVAQLLSYIFNPFIFFVLMPYIIIYRETGSNLYALKWGIFSFFFILIGFFVLAYGRRKGIFSDFDLSKREERAKFYTLLWPLLVTYLLSSVFFKGVFFPLSIIAFGIILGLIIFELVNTRVKASIHMGVLTAFIVTISFLYTTKFLIFGAICIPILGWSRIFLKRHTLQEVIIGTILGAIITLITLIIGVYTITFHSL